MIFSIVKSLDGMYILKNVEGEKTPGIGEEIHIPSSDGEVLRYEVTRVVHEVTDNKRYIGSVTVYADLLGPFEKAPRKG